MNCLVVKLKKDKKLSAIQLTSEAEAEDMVWWLKALVVLPEDLGSVPSTNTAAHNCL